MWPFGVEKDRTSLITPAMRTAAIRELGPRSRKADVAEQQQICQQLAQQIQTEPDPIVRKAIQDTIARFDSQLASAVLLAGLNDNHREVRLACCRHLGQRKEVTSVDGLKKLVTSDEDIDVRLAAVDALGTIGTPAGIEGISVALEDRDPALQFAAVNAMQAASGADLGNDVSAWRQYAASLKSQGEESTAIASEPTETARY